MSERIRIGDPTRIWCGRADVRHDAAASITRITVSFIITDTALEVARRALPGGDINSWSRALSQCAERGLVTGIQDSLPDGMRVRVDRAGIHLVPAFVEEDA